MKIIATMMVRDEIDLIAATVEHHLAQGVDLMIITDNASVDGTREVLQRYADLGVVELHDDPVHRKQQGVVVTGMARRARTEHAADWVINADADEFWVPVDKELTLRTVLEQIPLSLNAFQVPVTNLVGPPAWHGAGIGRLLWRDHRSVDELHAIGINAQPTDNVVHRGEPDVVVAQGNHFVSLRSNGAPKPALAIETLHLPWRSWAQLQQKVTHAGLAYRANPELRPSKNHHGMADFDRHQAGRLWSIWSLRNPSEAEAREGEAIGVYESDLWLRDHLHALVGRALCPDLLAAVLVSSDDELIDPKEHASACELGRQFVQLERARNAALRQADSLARQLAKERSARRDAQLRVKALKRQLKAAERPAQAARHSSGATPAQIRRRVSRTLSRRTRVVLQRHTPSWLMALARRRR